jgi:hypothetical protein
MKKQNNEQRTKVKVRTASFSLVLCSLSFVLALSGCDNMREGNRFKPYEETPFFEDGSVARQPVEGTVPQGFLRADKHLYEGKTPTDLDEFNGRYEHEYQGLCCNG